MFLHRGKWFRRKGLLGACGGGWGNSELLLGCEGLAHADRPRGFLIYPKKRTFELVFEKIMSLESED